jgi:general secretion pathway protein G
MQLHNTTPKLPSFRRRPRRRRGFTLLEVIVVVTIIALLAALVAPRMVGWIGKAKTDVAKAEVSEIAQQVQLYMVNHDMSKLPDGFELAALASGPDPQFDADDLVDPWESPYAVVSPGLKNFEFDIVSYGADGQPGGKGGNADITN